MDHCNSSQRCLAEVRGTWRVRVRVGALTGRGRGAVPVFAAVFTSAAVTAAASLAATFTVAAFSSDGRPVTYGRASLWCAATVEAVQPPRSLRDDTSSLVCSRWRVYRGRGGLESIFHASTRLVDAACVAAIVGASANSGMNQVNFACFLFSNSGSDDDDTASPWPQCTTYSRVAGAR